MLGQLEIHTRNPLKGVIRVAGSDIGVTHQRGKKGDILGFTVYKSGFICYLIDMPRKARLGSTGALQHIIVRGITKHVRGFADRGSAGPTLYSVHQPMNFVMSF
jgi:hypothetical protein